MGRLEERLGRPLSVLFTTGGSEVLDHEALRPHQRLLLKPFGIEFLSRMLAELSDFRPRS